MAEAPERSDHLGRDGPAEIKIEAVERLVEQHDFRARSERARQRDALLLPSGKLVRIAFRKFLHADKRQDLADPLSRPLPPREPEAHVPQDRQMREQGPFLGHVSDPSSLRRHMQAFARDLPAMDLDRAAVEPLEARDQPQQGGLAASRRTEQGGDLALAHGEVDATQHRLAIEGLLRLADADARHQRS